MRHLINCPRLLEASTIFIGEDTKVFLSKKDKTPYRLVSSENGMFLLEGRTGMIKTNWFWVADPDRKEQKLAQYECAGYLVTDDGCIACLDQDDGLLFMPISTYEKEVLSCR